MVTRRNGKLYKSILIEFEIGKCIHNGITFQNIGNACLDRAVAVDMKLVRLVRHMEVATLVVASRLHMGEKSAQERAQVGSVLFACGIGFPAKDALIFAVYGCHNFGCALSTPLGEQMGNFKIANAYAVAHIDPAVKLFKAERICAILKDNVYKLRSGSLAAYGGIKRGRMNGCE